MGAARQLMRSRDEGVAPAEEAGGGAGGGGALDVVADWAGILSLGEQQRLAFARC